MGLFKFYKKLFVINRGWRNGMKKQILQYLQKNKGGFISGQQISNVLGVTRTAIWKVISQLRQEGYRIESLPRKGYRLVESADVVTPSAVQSELKTKWIGQELLYFDTVHSTNDIIKQKAIDGAAQGLVVISEEQQKGRGRLGRVWNSPKGTGIWMSILLRPKMSPMEAIKLTLLAGTAVCQALRETTGLEVQIKWPNDLVLHGKKVCGILTEMSMELDQIEYVVLGIGINVNTEDFPDELKEIATSLYLERKQKWDRSAIIRKVLEIWEDVYEEFVETLSLYSKLDLIKQYSALLNKEVVVILNGEKLIGEAVDIASDGSLIVKKLDGSEISVISGEISIRGLHGYV